MNATHPHLVSVVTPFYNTEEYLAQCIESVLSQTYLNWEYVLVNNCSTDRSSEIANYYADRNKRIRLIHNDRNLTQVQNYNHALRQISYNSKYCKMVQADDWIFPECLSKMVECAQKDSSIGIVSAYSLHGSNVINDGLPFAMTTFDGRQVGRASLLLDGKQIFGSPSTVLFNSEVIRNCDKFFNEFDLFEDIEVCYRILQSWNFGFVYQVLTCCRTNNDGVSSTISEFDPFWFLSKYIRIKKYGNIYLNSQEFEERIKSIEKEYFSFLAHGILFGRGKKFWEFHLNGLKTIDYELRLWKLSKFICLEILDILFNPKATVGRVARRILVKKNKGDEGLGAQRLKASKE